MFEFGFEVKELFLDSAEIRRRIGAARAGVLRRQGSYIRTRVKTRVLRRRKTPAMPGQPPRIHSSNGLQKVLYFYDPRTETVVVGSVKLSSKKTDAIRLMEHGGTARVTQESRDGRHWRTADKRRKPGTKRRTVRAKYKGNPYMVVGLQQEIDAGTIPQTWRNAVRG